MASKQEALRFRVEKFMLMNNKMPKSFIVKHFQEEGHARSTLYSIISGHERKLSMKRKPGSGIKPKIFDSRKKIQLKKYLDHKDKVSVTSATKKFKCSRITINYWIKRLNIKLRKKKKAPYYGPGQDVIAKRLCAYLYNKFRHRNFVIDDEKYFTLTGILNNSFFSFDESITPDSVKYKQKIKFEPKVLLWIAISPNGVSKPYLRRGGLAIDQNVYVEECLKKRLIPFLREYHSDNKYIFWPDKASAHYAKTTTNFLKSQKVRFVPKYRNPTNVPQCRPIEDFFGVLSSKVYKNGWKAKNVHHLKKRILFCLRQFDKNIVQKSMLGVKKRLRRCALHGVYSVCH